MHRVSVGLFSFFVSLFLASSLFVGTIFAATYTIPEASDGQINEAFQKTVPLRFLPDNNFYFLIRVKESFNRFFQSSSAKKAQFNSVLATKRLKEVHELVGKGSIDLAADDLVRYRKVNEETIKQIDKARGQNQEMIPVVSDIAEDLKNEELMLFSISKQGDVYTNNEKFKQNFDQAVGSFILLALKIDEVKAGLKDRFKTVTSWEDSTLEEEKSKIVPTPEPIPATPSSSVRPKRIIY